ncbi:MAG: CRISPR-associated protein Cas4 [Aggregatilineales bacterium]
MLDNDGRHWLTVTHLKQYTFCPRVLYYELCTPTVRPRTYKMDAGAEAHEDEQERAPRRSFNAYGLPTGERRLDLAVESLSLGLRGIVDEVVITADEAIVVDYKMAAFAGENHQIQLGAYALLVEDTFQLPVQRGFLYLLTKKRFEEVKITPALRNSVRQILEDIRQIDEREAMPPPTTQRNKCAICEFKRFCNDIW